MYVLKVHIWNLQCFFTNFHPDDFDDEEKEREHSSLQNELGRELQELDKQLEQKEVTFVQIFYTWLFWLIDSVHCDYC